MDSMEILLAFGTFALSMLLSFGGRIITLEYISRAILPKLNRSGWYITNHRYRNGKGSHLRVRNYFCEDTLTSDHGPLVKSTALLLTLSKWLCNGLIIAAILSPCYYDYPGNLYDISGGPNVAVKEMPYGTFHWPFTEKNSFRATPLFADVLVIRRKEREQTDSVLSSFHINLRFSVVKPEQFAQWHADTGLSRQDLVNQFQELATIATKQGLEICQQQHGKLADLHLLFKELCDQTGCRINLEMIFKQEISPKAQVASPNH